MRRTKYITGKAACLKHFASKIGPNTICDIVIGEQGAVILSLFIGANTGVVI